MSIDFYDDAKIFAKPLATIDFLLNVAESASRLAAVDSPGRDDTRRQRLAPPVFQFLKNLERICQTTVVREIAQKIGIPEGRLYTISSQGKELPRVETILAIAARLGVLLDTLVVGIDANYDRVAQKMREVPSGCATDEVEPFPVTPSVQTPDGNQQEGAVDDYAALTFYLMKGLTRDEQKSKYEAFRQLIHDPPHPTARRGLSRRQGE